VADFVALLTQVSTPIKIGWVFWLTWSIVQTSWYRRSHFAAPVSRPAPRPQVPSRRRPDSVSTPKPSDVGNVVAGSNVPPRSNGVPPAAQASTSVDDFKDLDLWPPVPDPQ
jgi:hypothetical protein